MGVILRILAGKFGGFILGAVAAVLLGLFASLWVVSADRDKWRDVAGKRLGELQQCRSNVAVLDGALSRQNTAVAALKADAEKRQKASAAALSDARRSADGLRQDAQRVLQVRPGADQCASADALIIGSLSR
ncbi:hypothetical protein [Methylocaldum sp.]|uniref:hypothetical protein n=1 Tax=Methylocaldum sp. TaxID=1969727 RepID=UPI002D5AEB2C|nr:hypothetical protein [Methylocaldum sp.]HYE38241.1 hypothetical protein [Methylocaldum sp.]